MKPIHKLNGGRGATLCITCNAMICEGRTEDLFCSECVPQNRTYKLTRLNDNLINRGDKVLFVEWTEEGRSKATHETPKIGYSLILNPGWNYGWLTTVITEIIEQTETKLHFKTTNSEYILLKLI